MLPWSSVLVILTGSLASGWLTYHIPSVANVIGRTLKREAISWFSGRNISALNPPQSGELRSG